MTVPFRILSLLLCLLIAGPMSVPAHAVARPETRVGKIFSSPLKSASADLDQTAGLRWENPACGYDFASGVCKYLYAHNNPVNGIDPSGKSMLGDVMLSISIRVYLFAQTYAPIVNAARIGLGALTLGLVVADQEFAGIYLSSGGNPMAEANYVYGEIRTLRTALIAARAARAVPQAIQAFTQVEQRIIQEANQIYRSSEFAEIRAGQAAGKTVRVKINGRTIQFQAGENFCGLTWASENGFIIGEDAFRSEEELKKTVLHELERLTESTVLGGQGAIGHEIGAKETANAYNFAERAANQVK